MKPVVILLLLILVLPACNRTDRVPFRLPAVQGNGEGQAGSGGLPAGTTSLTAGREAARPAKTGKHRKKARRNAGRKPSATPLPVRDTLRISAITALRAARIEPDFNEPSVRRTLSGRIDQEGFQSLVTLSRESLLRIHFDNDILDYTDRFYTNGIRIDLISPGLRGNPVNRLLVPAFGTGMNYYGLSVVQNMYTPSTTKVGGIRTGDRPYAAYLYLGSFKITNDPGRRFRQTSEIDVGISGPNSYGEWVQRSFHNNVPTNDEPQGWEYQVQNDLVLNYSLSLEKGIAGLPWADVTVTTTGNLGTLYTNLFAGLQVRAGALNPWFSNLGIARKALLEQRHLRKIQYYFFVRGGGKLVGYDATLQGGLFNNESPYTLTSADISRLVLQASAGAALSVNGFRLEAEQFLLSPEFYNGWWHKWVHISLSFAL